MSWLASVGITLAGLAALIACDTAAETPAPAAAVEPADGSPDERVRWVEPLSLADTTAFEATGRLLAPANAQASIALPMTATVLELRTDAGRQVRAGDVLAVVVIADAANAAARMAGERLRQSAYRDRLEHLERLNAEGLARKGELAEQKARLRESEANALEAAAVLEAIESPWLRRRGRTYEVIASISGVVVEVHAVAGAVHGPGDGPLFVLAAGASSRVEARFAFSPPERVQYRLLDAVRGPIELRLAALDPRLSAADATQRAWLELPEAVSAAPGTLVRIGIAPAPDLWVVPNGALTTVSGASTLTAEGAEPAQVVVLARLGDQALVRGELRARARIRVAPEAAP